VKSLDYASLLSEVVCGLVLGAAIVAVPIFVLTPSENLSSWLPIFFGFFGTLLGAIIGALTSFAVYRKQKFERQITDAYSVWLTAQVAFSDFVTLRKWLDDAVAKAKKEKFKADFMWQIVEPFVASPPPISLPTTQLAVFAEAREYELLQNLVLLGLKHRSVCEGVVAYTKYRTEMRDIMSKKIGILQPKGSKSFASFFNKEEQQQLQPRFAELDSLLLSIRDLLIEDIVFCRKIVLAIGPAGRKYFGEDKFPNVKTVD
jgi:hypothetical protein